MLSRLTGRRKASQKRRDLPKGDPKAAVEQLKEELFQREHEIHDLEGVRDGLVEIVAWLLEQSAGDRGDPEQLRRTVTALGKAIDADAVRKGRRLAKDYVFGATSDANDPVDRLRGLAVDLLDEVLIGASSFVAPPKALEAIRADLASSRGLARSLGLVEEARRALEELARARELHRDERETLRRLLADSLAELESIGAALGELAEDPSWASDLERALESGDLAEAERVLRREGQRVRGMVAKVASAKEEMARTLVHEQSRVQTLTRFLSAGTEERDPRTGLGSQRALERRLADGLTRLEHVLSVEIEDPDALEDRFGRTALDRIVRAVGERVHSLVDERATVHRIGRNRLGCALPADAAAVDRALVERIEQAAHNIRFVFRGEGVTVQVRACPYEPSADPGRAATLPTLVATS